MSSYCHQCGNTNLEVYYEDQIFRSLKSTTLKNMKCEKCWECKEFSVTYTALGKLLRKLASVVASKTSALTEDETTFLIKMLPDSLQDRFDSLVRIQGLPLRIDTETELKEYLSEGAILRQTHHPEYLQYEAEYTGETWEIRILPPIQ